jgi:hypothetical protein
MHTCLRTHGHAHPRIQSLFFNCFHNNIYIHTDNARERAMHTSARVGAADQLLVSGGDRPQGLAGGTSSLLAHVRIRHVHRSTLSQKRLLLASKKYMITFPRTDFITDFFSYQNKTITKSTTRKNKTKKSDRQTGKMCSYMMSPAITTRPCISTPTHVFNRGEPDPILHSRTFSSIEIPPFMLTGFLRPLARARLVQPRPQLRPSRRHADGSDQATFSTLIPSLVC